MQQHISIACIRFWNRKLFVFLLVKNMKKAIFKIYSNLKEITRWNLEMGLIRQKPGIMISSLNDYQWWISEFVKNFKIKNFSVLFARQASINIWYMYTIYTNHNERKNISSHIYNCNNKYLVAIKHLTTNYHIWSI